MLDRLKTITERYNLTAIYAFGSRSAEIAGRLRGVPCENGDSESDLDIGVQPARGYRLTARDKVNLAITFEDLFEIRNVDLVVIHEAGPFLALDIIRGELLYSGNLDDQAEHELYIMRQAGDLAHFERLCREMVLMEAEK